MRAHAIYTRPFGFGYLNAGCDICNIVRPHRYCIFDTLLTSSLNYLDPSVSLSMLRSLLKKVKEIEKCFCGKVYIRETILRLEERIKEHVITCRRGKTVKLVIAEHA